MNRILRSIVILLGIVAAAALILVYGFRIRTITVEGNDRYSAEEISSDLLSCNLMRNTIYFGWTYRSPVTSADAPYLTSVRARILSPTEVKVTVTESTLIGRVQYKNKNVYFDENGVVQMITDEVRENIPLVTGVDIDQPTLYQKLSLSNASTLRTMLSVTQLLIQEDFIPDSVTFDESGNMTIRFGSVAVKLGQDEYLEEKIANLVQIYPQLSSRSGTLNMEGFTGKNSSITFRESSADKGENETEEEDSPGETLAGVGTDSKEEEGSKEEDADASGQQTDQEDASGQQTDQADASGQQTDQTDTSTQTVGSGVMVFDSNGTLHYDARIVGGQVVDASGNPIAGCTVDENGNIKDAYWNVIDPVTGQLLS